MFSKPPWVIESPRSIIASWIVAAMFEVTCFLPTSETEDSSKQQRGSNAWNVYIPSEFYPLSRVRTRTCCDTEKSPPVEDLGRTDLRRNAQRVLRTVILKRVTPGAAVVLCDTPHGTRGGRPFLSNTSEAYIDHSSAAQSWFVVRVMLCLTCSASIFADIRARRKCP